MYRYKFTKKQCLINALVWTPILLIYVLVSMSGWPGAGFGGRLLLSLCMLIVLITIGVHWYRWLAYDKK